MLRHFESYAQFDDPFDLITPTPTKTHPAGIVTYEKAARTEAICDWCGAKEVLDTDEEEPFRPFALKRNWVVLRCVWRNASEPTRTLHFCSRACREKAGLELGLRLGEQVRINVIEPWHFEED